MLCLSDMFGIKIDRRISSLAHSDSGNLAITSDECAYIFNPHGKLLNKVCGKFSMDDASYSNGRFGFINRDSYAYITDENGKLIKRIRTGDYYNRAITMTPDGFMVCGRKCAFFDFSGNKIWSVELDFSPYGRPAFHNGYWYVPGSLYELFIVKDGSIIKKIPLKGDVLSVATCGDYLAVSTMFYIYLYRLDDPENPEEIWKINKVGEEKLTNNKQVAFSPDCKYIAVANTNERKLLLFKINGELALSRWYGPIGRVTLVDWRRDILAVGIDPRLVSVFRIGYPAIKFPALKL